MHSIVLRLKSLFTIPFSLTIVLVIIEILRIFALNGAFFWLMQNKKKYRTSLVSTSIFFLLLPSGKKARCSGFMQTFRYECITCL